MSPCEVKSRLTIGLSFSSTSKYTLLCYIQLNYFPSFPVTMTFAMAKQSQRRIRQPELYSEKEGKELSFSS